MVGWLVGFDLAMPREVFNLLHKIVGESKYGLEIQGTPRCVTLAFTKKRRLVVVFEKFIDCKGFEKQLKDGKGHVKLIVDAEKKGIFEYMVREELLRAKLYYGYWNQYGISQH